MIYHGRIRKNNKSKLLIFHGPCAILAPPSSIRSSLAGTEPSPLMRYETYTFFVVVNLRGIPGKSIWQLSHASNGKISGRHLSTKLEKKRIPTEHFLITNPRSQPKSEDPNFSHIPTNFLIAAQFVPFSWMVFLVGLLNPPTPPQKKRAKHRGFQPCGSWIPSGPGGVVDPLRGNPGSMLLIKTHLTFH